MHVRTDSFVVRAYVRTYVDTYVRTYREGLRGCHPESRDRLGIGAPVCRIGGRRDPRGCVRRRVRVRRHWVGAGNAVRVDAEPLSQEFATVRDVRKPEANVCQYVLLPPIFLSRVELRTCAVGFADQARSLEGARRHAHICTYVRTHVGTYVRAFVATIDLRTLTFEEHPEDIQRPSTHVSPYVASYLKVCAIFVPRASVVHVRHASADDVVAR